MLACMFSMLSVRTIPLQFHFRSLHAVLLGMGMDNRVLAWFGCYLWDGRVVRSWGNRSSRVQLHRLRRQLPESLQRNPVNITKSKHNHT